MTDAPSPAPSMPAKDPARTSPPAPSAPLDAAAVQRLLDGGTFAAWVRRLAMQVVAVHGDGVELRLPLAAEMVHSGGVLCGQTMMAAADTAMVLAISARMGGFRPMTTVQLQTSFLRPVAGDGRAATVVARVLRAGRQLVFGEIEVLDADGRLAAHATTTYALL